MQASREMQEQGARGDSQRDFREVLKDLAAALRARWNRFIEFQLIVTIGSKEQLAGLHLNEAGRSSTTEVNQDVK